MRILSISHNKIKYHDLKPYLEFETFNLYNFLFYEDIRTKHNLTHLEALILLIILTIFQLTGN